MKESHPKMGRGSQVKILKNVHFRSLRCAKGEQPGNGLNVKKINQKKNQAAMNNKI